jgi:predicted TIM-barrel fold metal-dependent hydrolase
MRIVDVWMQHPTPRFLEQPFFESLRRWSRQESIPEVPLSHTIGAMDQAGVDLGLTAAWWGPNGALISNDEVAGFIAQHPDRLIGVASVNLARPMEAVRELRRCVRELGFRALRIVPWLWGLPPDDRRYYPLYAECIELDIPFCLQVGHTGPLLTSETGRPNHPRRRILRTLRKRIGEVVDSRLHRASPQVRCAHGTRSNHRGISR